ncbi:MAG: hypothetical protein RIF41_22825 [Polyangiaceae bacterium]
MTRSQQLGVHALLSVLAGCGAATDRPAPPRRSPSEISATPRLNVPPEEPTLATAGGPCREVGDTVLGAAVAGTTAVAFGSEGGLASWRTDDGLGFRPLDAMGAPIGPARHVALDFPPALVLASGSSFVAIAQGRRAKRGRCPSKCYGSVAYCSDSYPGGIPQVCPRPCSVDCVVPGPVHVVAMAVELDGAPSEPVEVVLEGHPIATLTGDHHGRFAAVTADGHWLELHHEGRRVTVTERDVTLAESVLPVRGIGAPAFLTGNERALNHLVTSEGSRDLSSDARVLEHTGMVVDGRLQARYGPDGAVHVAWVGWLERFDRIGYAVLDGDTLRFVGEQRAYGEDLRAPFRDYLAAWVVRGALHRESWLQGEVDDGVPLGNLSDGAVGWTGEHLVVTYRRGDQARARTFRCDGGRLDPLTGLRGGRRRMAPTQRQGSPGVPQPWDVGTVPDTSSVGASRAETLAAATRSTE